MSRRGIPPAPSCNAFPKCVGDALEQVSRYVRSSGGHRGRLNDLQAIIDRDIFCLNERKACRLSHVQALQLLRILALYFEKEEKMPGQAPTGLQHPLYVHFEVIFLGREGETLLHSARLSLLYRFASYALQHPYLGVFRHLAAWLKKMSARPVYAEGLITLFVEHFIYPNPDLKLYEFLLPLESESPDFCLYMIALAPRESSMGFAMATVIVAFLEGRTGWLVEALAEQPELVGPFAKQTFPVLLRYAIQGSEDEEEEERDEDYASDEEEEGEDLKVEHVISTLHTVLLGIIGHWQEDDNCLDISALADPQAPLVRRRIELLCGISTMKSPAARRMQKVLNEALPGGLAAFTYDNPHTVPVELE